MTCREKLKKEHPTCIDDRNCGGCFGCPSNYRYLDNPEYCPHHSDANACTKCWNREIPEDNITPQTGFIVFRDGHTEDMISVEVFDDEVLFRTKWNAYKYEKTNNSKCGFYILCYQVEDGAEFYEVIDTIDYIEYVLGDGTRIRYNACPNREIPEDVVDKLVEVGLPNPVSASELASVIKDSGDRTEFSTGAVRDMHEGKGRCDLMPLDVVARICNNFTLMRIASFMKSGGQVDYLYDVLRFHTIFEDPYTMFLEVAKHFEDGAKKYGPDNWRKGIPVNCYIDSAVRHYLKHLRGDTDERHDRAFVWNILCCIWTVENMPELNNYRKDVN